MAAFDKESYKERESQYRTDEINHGRFSGAAAPDPDDDLLDDDDDLSTDTDLDDDNATIGDDDLDDADLDDADLDDEDDDLTDSYSTAITSEEDIESGEGEGTEPNFSPDETPERRTSEQEGTGYDQQVEARPQQSDSDANYSEQNDVTPPNPHEFPSVGANTEVSFEARPHGRTTGRMVEHEPGTEGI